MSSKPYTHDYWQPFTKAEQTTQWVAGIGEQFKAPVQQKALPLKTTDPVWVCQTHNAVWLLYSMDNAGFLAVRLCFDPQGILQLSTRKRSRTSQELTVRGALGRYRITLSWKETPRLSFHYSTTFTPETDVLIQAFPKDLYMLDQQYDPFGTEGVVYTQQNGPTSGCVYFSLTKPVAGSFVYFQNLTALNPYCQTTQTDPSDCVGAQWPELGFSLPPAKEALKAGAAVTVSDAWIYLYDQIPETEYEAADQFLEAMATIYRELPAMTTQYVDWPKMAGLSIQDLESSPKCGRTINEHFYVNAYVDVTQKPPESMVQLAILVPLLEYQEWSGKQLPLVEKLRQSLPNFYDEGHRTIMRWLPEGTFTGKKEDRSEEQDPDKIDSWYLLHTLMNLGRLAAKGDTMAKKLLLDSVQYVMNAARQFDYNWPVFYDIRTFAVIKAETADGKGGELDVAGLYTHVMLQVYELTKENKYLEEAVTSAERLRGKGFELLYQSNITLMTALTLVKLWRLTGNRLYFDQSRLSIANMVARFWIWESHYGFGQFRSTFLGVAPLKAAPYLAAYEEAEIAATMVNYLKETGADTPEPVRLFFSEFIAHLLHRAMYYFPFNLPADSLSEEVKEGHIDTSLHIPVEDIGTGWQKAGSVGQEVYGGALAYILTTYTYHRFADVPVDVYCTYPVTGAEFRFTDKKSGYLGLQLAGTADRKAVVRVIYRSRGLKEAELILPGQEAGDPVKPVDETGSYKEYIIAGNQQIRVRWSR